MSSIFKSLINPNHFVRLISSNLNKQLDENNFSHLFVKDGKLQYATVNFYVYRDGSISYSEYGEGIRRFMILAKYTDTSEYQGKINPHSLQLYSIILDSCLNAERTLAPKGLVPQGYSVTLSLTKTVYDDINYSIKYKEGKK